VVVGIVRLPNDVGPFGAGQVGHLGLVSGDPATDDPLFESGVTVVDVHAQLRVVVLAEAHLTDEHVEAPVASEVRQLKAVGTEQVFIEEVRFPVGGVTPGDTAHVGAERRRVTLREDDFRATVVVKVARRDADIVPAREDVTAFPVLTIFTAVIDVRPGNNLRPAVPVDVEDVQTLGLDVVVDDVPTVCRPWRLGRVLGDIGVQEGPPLL